MIPCLFLPVPVYRDTASRAAMARRDVRKESRPHLVWFAPDRQAEGTVPIYRIVDHDAVA